MPKKEKEKKTPAPAVPLPGFTEEERVLEVLLRWDGAAPDVLLVLRLNQQEHYVQPRLLPTETQGGPSTDGLPHQPQPASAAPPLLPLAKQAVPVGDSATRHTLLNDRGANRIDVYALPGLGDGDEAGGRQAGGAAGKRRKSAAPAASKAKGKSPAGLTALPDGARRIGGTALSLTPLLSTMTMDVAVPLAAGSLIDADDCLHFRVQCRDSPLLSAQCVAQCRPLLVRVYDVAGLPASTSASVSSPKKDAAAAPAADSRRRLRACVSVAGARVMMPVAPARSAAVDAAVPSSSLLHDAVDASFHDHVLFLEELGTPLDVYRRLHSAPCEVSLWQSFEMDAGGAAKAGASASTQPQKDTEALLGSGSFSVRDFLTDDQTQFTESVQLLPSRSTVELARGRSCLTTGSTISVRLDFFQRFTAVQHVDKDGQPQPRTSFLSHALLRFPYAAPWTVDLLAVLLREVTALPRATQDVQQYLPPPPPPPPAEATEKEKQLTGAGRTGVAAGRGAAPSGGATPATAAAAASTAATASTKLPVVGGHKGGKNSGRPVPPDPLPAPPVPSFADALKLYSPPGLSGFEVADGEERLWCLEGTVPEVQRVLTQLGGFVEARGGVSAQVRVLFNAELFVPQRAYMTFPPLVVPPAGMATPAPRPGEAEGVVTALEVEPSGTGGRLHRIRLRSALAALCETQSHYVRHTLSDDCLRCLQSLAALRTVGSMREAEGRGWLPSATLLIAAERSFGQTLEKEDLFGVVVSADATAPPAPAAAVAMSVGFVEDAGGEASATHAGGAAAASLMTDAAVGSLVFFDGMLKAGTRRPVPAAVRLRFPVSAWMVVTGSREEVLCAFPHNTPTGLVQYHIEGQVVRCSTAMVLYVLKCACLARSVTHSHNAAYERVLHERLREQYALLQEKSGPVATDKFTPGRPPVAGAPHRSVDRGRASGADRALGPESSDDDDAGGDAEWLDSDMDRYLYTSSAPMSKSSAVSRRLPLDRTSSQRTSLHSIQRRPEPGTAASPSDFTYDELWRMYEQRGPTPAAAATSAHDYDKLPPIRF
ncbi:hypothetical protein NESM_000463800 [Novymonas esmeraldas]|uniref:Uncharacterized protein n=1 Tax=Novymonas esmeraldas TaxID=1808958 RepID=A0AAW0EQ89_9TRYP